jgi:hypothetical protein
MPYLRIYSNGAGHGHAFANQATREWRFMPKQDDSLPPNRRPQILDNNERVEDVMKALGKQNRSLTELMVRLYDKILSLLKSEK